MPETKLLKNFNVRRLLIFLLIGVLLFLFVSGVISPIGLWDKALLEPMLNFLILLTRYLLSNFGLAIIVLTIVIRVIMFPLTLQQLRQSKAMQQIQPKMRELQKKYAKDQQKLGQETMKLYKESGVNPLGCALPMLIQFPIWIALYQSVIQVLAYTPENLLGLSKHMYHWSKIQEMVPLNSHFLWLDLNQGDLIMAILTAASMWVLQKMSSTPTTDPQQQTTNRLMLWIMPLMFGLFALSLPSGLSVYWVVSNIISIVMQYRVTGWGTLTMPSLPVFGKKAPQATDAPANNEGASEEDKKSVKKVAAQEELAVADSGGSDSKKAVGGRTISQRRKGRYGKHRSKRKN